METLNVSNQPPRTIKIISEIAILTFTHEHISHCLLKAMEADENTWTQQITDYNYLF
jgi:hypothetical protein